MPTNKPVSLDQLATTLEVPADLVDQATSNLADGTSACLVASGWMGSGKDSVAPEVLSRRQFHGAEHRSYAAPLKAETDRLILEMRKVADATSRRAALRLADTISEVYAMPSAQALTLIEALHAHVLEHPTVDAYSRTPQVRFALQYLGTDIRRAQDEDYWVKLAFRSFLQPLAAGRSLYLTDGRFPNEVAFAQQTGALAVRLDITRETQLQRLRGRDGRDPDPAALFHKSEIALDSYESFDVRVWNEGPFEEVVEEIVARLSDIAPAAKVAPAA